MFKIGDFSKFTMISIRMLRHYNDIGLLVPDYIDEYTGYRYYSLSQLSEANRIQSLKYMGFSLALIKDILKQYNDADSLKQYLIIHYSDMVEKSKLLDNQILALKTIIDKLGEDENIMKYNTTIKELPEMYVASLRSVIPKYADEGILWGKLCKETASYNLQQSNPGYAMAVFYDEGFKEHDVDVEIQMSVVGKYKDTENVKFKTLKPVTVASTIVKGPFDFLTEANQEVVKWITSNNYEFAGTAFTIYHAGPGNETDPEKFVSEICFPVKKK